MKCGCLPLNSQASGSVEAKEGGKPGKLQTSESDMKTLMTQELVWFLSSHPHTWRSSGGGPSSLNLTASSKVWFSGCYVCSGPGVLLLDFVRPKPAARLHLQPRRSVRLPCFTGLMASWPHGQLRPRSWPPSKLPARWKRVLTGFSELGSRCCPADIRRPSVRPVVGVSQLPSVARLWPKPTVQRIRCPVATKPQGFHFHLCTLERGGAPASVRTSRFALQRPGKRQRSASHRPGPRKLGSMVGSTV